MARPGEFEYYARRSGLPEKQLGVSFAWLGTPNASLSSKRENGVEIRRNQATNPNFELDVAGWALESTAVLTRETASPISGTGSGNLSGGGDVYVNAPPAGAAGECWAFSFDYKTVGTVTGTPQLYLTWLGGAPTASTVALPLTQAVAARFSTTLMLGAGATSVIGAVFAPATGNIIFDNVLLEKLPTGQTTVLPYFDGSSPAGSTTLGGTLSDHELAYYRAQIGQPTATLAFAEDAFYRQALGGSAQPFDTNRQLYYWQGIGSPSPMTSVDNLMAEFYASQPAI